MKMLNMTNLSSAWLLSFGVNGTQQLFFVREDVNISAEVAEAPPYILDLPAVRAIIIVLYSLVFFFCFLGNVAVILVTTLHYKMRNSTKFFLAHLAAANLCVGIFCVYQHMSVHLYQTWVFGEFLCKMYHFVVSLSHTASVLILVVTAMERYCVIVYPIRSRWLLTMRRKLAVIASIWLSSGALSFHKFYYVTTMEHPLRDTNSAETICAMDVSRFDHKLADLLSFFLLFLGPVALMSAMYIRIVIYLRKQAKQFALLPALPTNNNSVIVMVLSPRTGRARRVLRRQSLGGRQIDYDLGNSDDESWSGCWTSCFGRSSMAGALTSSPENSREGNQEPNLTYISFRAGRLTCFRKQRAATKSVIIVAMCFVVCNLPYYIRKMLQHFTSLYDNDDRWLELFAPVTFLLMCLNCAVNPFLHALLNRNFQRCLLDVLTCKHRRQFAPQLTSNVVTVHSQ